VQENDRDREERSAATNQPAPFTVAARCEHQRKSASAAVAFLTAFA